MTIKLRLVLLFSIAFTLSNVGYTADGRFCQQGAVVIFGNGVWNTKEDADSSRRLLERRLETIISGTDLDGIITYGTAHNATDGALQDLLETFVQNAQTDYSQFWRFLAGLDPMPDFLQDKVKEIANKVDEAVVRANPAVQAHAEKYNSFLSEGNKMVLVAHSQGNLFANIAYLDIDSEYIGGFGIVSVGNPDSYVAGGGPYTTLTEDIVIGNVPDSLPANVNNFFGINLKDVTGHEFGRSYLASGRSAEAKILNDTIGQINGLSYPETDLGSGIVTATLTWGSNPDLDLHVFEPNGTHVYYANLSGPSGYLDRDDVSGFGPEHYYVSCDTVETGTYRFGVNYYHGSSAETGTLTLKTGEQIRSRQQTFTQWLGSSGNANPFIMFELQITGSQEEGFEFVVQ